MSATFAYTARDPLGKLINGSLSAGSRDEAMQSLRRDGFTVVNLDDEVDDGGGSLFPRRVKRAELINVTTQLALMVDTGITLSAALESIAGQEENPTLKELLLELKNNVEAGEDFSTSLARYPKYFDQTYISLVKASEETGLLAEMLDRIAAYMQKEADTRARVRGAMAYPAVMATVAIGVTIFLLTFVLPKFQPLFESRGTKLPTITIVLMHTSYALMGYWYLWLLGLVALIVGFLLGKRTEPGKLALDWAKINAPIVGPVIRKVLLSRTIRTLGTMLSSGVAILDALQLASKVAGNSYFEAMWQRVIDRVTTGSQVCESLAGEPLMPATVVQMIGSGEETGKLDKVLERLSTHFDRDVDGAIKTATSLIEPLMIVVMGVVVGAIAMGLLLPIFSLSRGG
jgi:type IV pilus assembly protein PilC